MDEHEPLEPAELKIRGWAMQRTSIDNAKRELAALHGVKVEEVGHCIDSRTHSEFGRNQKFVAMKEKATGAIHLARQTRGGHIEIVPYQYLASLLHKRTATGKERYVHFYIMREWNQ